MLKVPAMVLRPGGVTLNIEIVNKDLIALLNRFLGSDSHDETKSGMLDVVEIDLEKMRQRYFEITICLSFFSFLCLLSCQESAPRNLFGAKLQRPRQLSRKLELLHMHTYIHSKAALCNTLCRMYLSLRSIVVIELPSQGGLVVADVVVRRGNDDGAHLVSGNGVLVARIVTVHDVKAHFFVMNLVLRTYMEKVRAKK